MSILWDLCGVLGGYLLGCVNTAALLARAKGFDIRKSGSGNAGASNALVTMGKGAAVCTALVDIAKAFLPVWILLHISLPEDCRHLPIVTGIAVILGHMFPFWMRFRGGKGFASLLGLALALDWRFFLIGIAVTVAILLTVRYIALATIICTALLPLGWYWKSGSVPELCMLILLAVCIIVKHIQNLRRIANRTEIPFQLRKKNH